MPTKKPILLWFRQDLRIRDNAALAAAMETGGAVIPVFVWDEGGEGNWAPGGASRVFLQAALKSLQDDLAGHGLKLVLRRGASREVLRDLCEETGADGVYWNRRYEPQVVRRDSDVKQFLREEGLEAESFNSSLLFEPWEVANQQGQPFQVFTPFWKRAQNHPPSPPVSVDLRKLVAPGSFPDSDSLDSLRLVPRHPWTEKVGSHWVASEEEALRRVRRFLAAAVEDYSDGRNFPGEEGTSRLSPYLHWGLIGPRQIWQKVLEKGAGDSKGGRTFLSEIGWREFAYHVLYHFPHTPERPLREKYEDFPWQKDAEILRRWRKGLTGYPIVDAGMRQLWEEGWMHNRVRMIVGSLLVKHLLHSWSHGARWFWNCLVDADLASNTLGWQWTGGCGADAAPYFRVFNPITQGQKFDPDGGYVRRYVPELASLPNERIHSPWEASQNELAEAGVILGREYPRPIIDHREGRNRALAAFEEMKG